SNPLCTPVKFSVSKIVAATIGLVAPRYRTLGQWCGTYRQILAGRPISGKTRANRASALGHIERALGGRLVGAIRPHEVARLVQQLAATTPQCAKRVLFEARDVFGEAVNYGWIDRNPAAALKVPVVRIRRARLTLDQWRKIHAWSLDNQPLWVSRMLMLALITAQRRSDLRKMRFADVWDDHLHIEQDKTGARLALPLALRLDAIGVGLAEAIDACIDYAAGDEHLLRKSTGRPPVLASLSARFEEAREAVMPAPAHGLPASLHEIRSLSERLYREQGIDTQTLLGHKHQAMTDLYNDDRGLSAGKWKTLALQS
ncbi:MAG: tyrosine-type recombinase/integrase, partial [Burkholderiaceae bacterium]|nr:tyrosine-type recombinase/integrase [Burkholderiaceae bacterium]